MERIRAARNITDPPPQPLLQLRTKYERMSIAINDYKPDTTSWLDRKFAFLRDHVDTSAMSGKPILNIAMREGLDRQLPTQRRPRARTRNGTTP